MRATDLGRQIVDGLAHVLERCELECVNCINCRVDIVEGRLQFFNTDRGIRGLVGDLQGLLAQHLRSRLDDVARGGVERGYLIQHELLVAERQRRDDRRAQCRNSRGGGSLDAFYQLDVVLADQVEGEIPLNDDGELRQQVLALLADVEERVFLSARAFSESFDSSVAILRVSASSSAPAMCAYCSSRVFIA